MDEIKQEFDKLLIEDLLLTNKWLFGVSKKEKTKIHAKRLLIKKKFLHLHKMCETMNKCYIKLARQYNRKFKP
jgi:hypothetical protein